MGQEPSPAGLGSIDDDDRTGRIGVMYVRSLLAQAGISNEEMSPGEDYSAVDLTVHLRLAAVTAQIKTGRVPRRNKDGSYSVKVTDTWCRKWADQKIPVYLVYVVLSRTDFERLAHHDERSTTWHAHAYWLRVNSIQAGTVRVPVHNRLSLDSFLVWAEDVRRVFGEEAAA